MSGTIVTLLAESDAERYGRISGIVMLCTLLAAGIAKCYAISLRRNTNAKAARGLMLLLGGWLAATIGGNLAAFNSDDEALRTLVLMVGGLIALASAVAGGVLAVLGVAEIRANRQRYTQGMRQAITALVLCVVMVGLAGAGAVTAFNRAGGAREVAALASADQPGMGESIRHDALNFAFTMPHKPWVQTDAKKLSTDACLALMRTRPQIAFQVIAEDAAGPVQIDDAALAELAMANLASAAVEHEVLDRHPHTVDGIDGIRIFSRARVGGHAFYYVHWVTSHGGFLYQLVTWGKPSDESEVRAASDELSLCFHLIDRERQAPAPLASAGQLRGHRSDRYGYSLRLRGEGWTRWEEAAQSMPLAEFAAQHGGDAVVAAMPIALFGADPSPEALFDAMLLNATQIDPKLVTDRGRATLLGTQGYTATYSRFLAGARYDYRFLVVRTSRFAYLCAGWTTNRAKIGQIEDSIRSMVVDAVPPHSFAAGAMAPGERERHGLVLNELGLALFNQRQYGAAAALFEKSTELRPDEVVSENAVTAHLESGHTRNALAAAERAVARHPNRPSLRALVAQLQAQAGNERAAIDAYAQLFAQGYQEDPSMTHYLTLLAKAERVDEAIAAAERYQRRFDSRAVAMDLAALMGMKGEHGRAAEMLAQRQAQSKVFDAELAVATAERQVFASRFADAHATVSRAIAAGDQTALAYWVRGEAEVGLGRHHDAKASFEAAAARAPGDARVTESIKYVNALLGEGDNSLIKEVIDAVALPASLAAPGDADGKDDPDAAKLADGAGGYYLHRAMAVSFVAGKEHKSTEYRLVRVLDASGVAAFNTFTFAFDPLFEHIHVNRLDVRDAGGKVVASGRVADYFVTDESDAAGGSGVASQKKVLTIPVPGLKPGFTIDLVVTRKDLRAPDALPFTEHIFIAPAPMARAVLFVRGDVAGIHHQASAGVTRVEVDGGAAWTIDDLPAYTYEPLQAPLLEFTPHVTFGGTGSDWATEAKQYHASIADLLAPDSAAAALAKRLTADVKDDAQRVGALVRHVQQEYAYRAIAFGKRARIPQRCADVIQNRWGDCKDHSLLLQQLLTAAGYPAQLALVRSAGGPLVKELPSLDQFDHMIVYAPSIGGPEGSFFDCTDKYGNLTAAAPYGLAGGEALLIDAANPRLIPIPGYADGSGSISSDRTVTIRPDGGVAVTETLTFDGYNAMLIRANLLAYSAKDRAEVVRKLVDDPALDVTVGDVQIRDLEDRAKPLALEVNYTINKRFTRHAGGFSGSVPAVLERLYVQAPQWTTATRQTPFSMETPLVFRSTVTVNVPEGFALAQLPPNHAADDRTTSVRVMWSKEGDALRAEATLRSPAGVYPAAEYAAFEQSRKLAVAALEPALALVPIAP